MAITQRYLHFEIKRCLKTLRSGPHRSGGPFFLRFKQAGLVSTPPLSRLNSANINSIITLHITFESEERMHSSHEPTGDRFDLLLAGLNRVRFLQKRQTSNNNKMAQHLALMVNRFSQQKGQILQGGLRHSAQRQKERGGRKLDKQDGQKCSMTRVNTSRQKFKISAVRSKYAMQTTQEDSSLLKTTQDFEESLAIPNANSSASPPKPLRTLPQASKLKEVLEGKTANYRLMKEREQQMELIRRLKSEESQRLLRDRVVRAAAKKQEGRRKIEDNYFEYIENVHAEKDLQKQRKNRMTEKKMQEMLKLQLEEKSQIQQFQSSLALEEHLKSFLKDKLPLGSPGKGFLAKESFFS